MGYAEEKAFLAALRRELKRVRARGGNAIRALRRFQSEWVSEDSIDNEPESPAVNLEDTTV